MSGWNIINKNSRYLYLSVHRSSAVVRFVGHQKELFVSFDSLNRKYRFSENKNEDNNLKCSRRIVSLVIDREDERVKAFACPFSAWNYIEKFDMEYDYKIQRSGIGLSTKYTVEKKEKTNITDRQKEIVESTLHNFSLEDMFIYKEDEWEFSIDKEEPISSRFEILDL